MKMKPETIARRAAKRVAETARRNEVMRDRLAALVERDGKDSIWAEMLAEKTSGRLNECEGAMARLRATFKLGDNRFGEYGKNVREAFARHAKVYAEITGKPEPTIYD
jgi:O-methyltransferase involved in polyketide biosynthesis